MLENTLCKVIQRKTYTCLSHKYGIYFAYSGLIIVLYSMFHFGEELLEWSHYQYEVAFSVYHDNIASKSFQHRLCSDLPIDVVYTWVNGSCPLLMAELNKYKHISNLNSTNDKDDLHIPCHHKNCLLLPVVVVNPALKQNELQSIKAVHQVQLSFPFNVSKDVVLGHVSNSTIIRFNNIDHARAFYSKRNLTNSTFTWLHVTTDGGASQSQILLQALILKSLPDDIKSESQLLQHIPAILKEKLDWIHFSSEKNIAFMWLTDRSVVDEFVDDKANSSLKHGFKIDDHSVTIHSAYFVNVVHETSDSDIVSRSRFEDNEELRYSLRSLEKFAPWVHHVFIVTNGQIPYWLNMDSPHVTLVTHEEIFVNKSHLPTFSSPAIEAHIHRIPGLSDKFIYFNDDVMFGKEVWPEDFYTKSSGQKIYLSWPVPNCAEGCAPSWITDGYCDAACNVSDCNWDGGDCTGSNVKAGVGVNNNLDGMNMWQNSFTQYCKPGCSNTWLADKFCDQACNNYECGFDAGDCGLGDYSKLFKLTSKLSNDSTYTLPAGKHVGYVELSKTFMKVISASYEANKGLRVAAVSNKYHVLTMVFNPNANDTEVVFNLTGTAKEETNDSVFFQFKVSAFPIANVTNATIEHDKQVKVEVEENVKGKTSNASSEEFLPEIIVIDVPEDMKMPQIKKSPKQRDYELPFAIDQINKTLLPESMKSQIMLFDTELQENLLTDNGYKLKMYHLLKPYLKEMGLSIPAKRVKGDRGEMEDNKDLAANHSKDNADRTEDNIQENAHSHKKGDPGTNYNAAQVAHPLLYLRKNVPPIFNKPSSRSREDEMKGQSFSNLTERVKTRKLQSFEIALGAEFEQDGVLPWEKKRINFSSVNEKDEENEVEQKYKTIFQRRKLLDTFGSSLRFVSKLFNERFGFMQRKVPAHMPHMIDKKVMTELQSKYSEEYDATSSHRLRHPQDMQFAFSYFYFLMSEERAVDPSEAFDEFDTDGSKVLSDREIRLLSTRLFDLPLTLQELTSIEEGFKTCAWNLYGSDKDLKDSGNQTVGSYTQPINGLEEWAITENYFDKNMPLVTKEVFLNCPFIIEIINKTFSGRKKYKYQACKADTDSEFIESAMRDDIILNMKKLSRLVQEVCRVMSRLLRTVLRNKKRMSGLYKRLKNVTEMDQDEIAFKMIRDNVSTVVGQLDDIRKNPKKFVCLNDNINHELEGTETVKAVIRDFYETFFPKQSQFELPHDYRNRFTNIKDLKSWKNTHEKTLFIMHCLLGFLFACVILSFFWENLQKIWRRYRYIIKRKTFFKLFGTKRTRNPV